MTIAATASLIVGLIIGYLGQRSCMCFVGAVRDFLLIGDTDLLKGVGAFALVAWLAFPIAGLLGGAHRPIGATPTWETLVLIVIGGFGVGYISTLANGCPFRQHVLAGQGALSAAAYLVGFGVGAVLFHLAVAPALIRLLP
ncbi:MAG: YeeE/YedE family protein [Ardenticatenaceae bacterium]|nr:YeeE/YedE family protein [Ardenticatenaceae bacterium]